MCAVRDSTGDLLFAVQSTRCCSRACVATLVPTGDPFSAASQQVLYCCLSTGANPNLSVVVAKCWFLGFVV